MLNSKNCIRLGQVLMDENRQFFILCNNCHSDIKNMPDFRRHSEKCKGIENIFRDDHILRYNTAKSTHLYNKTTKGIKEFLIYDYTDVDTQLMKTEKDLIDLSSIEEELLDPKWYSDSCQEENKSISKKSSKQYDDLVEEVTPFVQFKENVGIKTIPEGRSIHAQVNNTISGQKPKQANKVIASMKRKLPATNPKPPKSSIPLVNQTEFDTGQHNSCKLSHSKNLFHIPLVKRCRTDEKISVVQKHGAQEATSNKLSFVPINSRTPQITLLNQPSASSTSSRNPKETLNNLTHKPLLPNPQPNPSRNPKDTLNNLSHKPLIPNPQPAKENQTAQILNKLQNLGLQVKRTNSFATPIIDSSKKTNDKTLEILKKLQSKGMKVKVLKKQSTTATAIQENLHVPSVMPDNMNQTRACLANVVTKQSINKNLIIRKVN